MKKNSSDENPYKTIARFMRALEPLVSEQSKSPDLSEALNHLSRYLSKTSRSDIESVIARGSLATRSRIVDDSVIKIPLVELEFLINSGRFSRRQLEVIANKRFGVPVGSMRSFPRTEHLVMKLLTLIENERTHEVIDAAARRTVD